MADFESKDASRWGGGQGISAVAKYNPHLWSEDELRAIFVVRQRELADIMQAVRVAKPGCAPQHILITGQRGMGKTTLLQRVALALREDAQLCQNWLPLRFPEEQYTVSTPGELWSNVIGSLADELERQGQPTARLDAELARLGALAFAEREQEALAWLQNWCDSNQKRLLLLVDNTDMLFDNLASGERDKVSKTADGGATALWRVRKVLLHSPHFFWLGGSYQPLEARGLYSDAFLDFFQLIELRLLSLEEMQTAILALARTFGAGRGLRGAEAEAEVRKMLTARPERLRAMRQLTGGNPRTTITLYELFAAGGGDNLRVDLERLLDAMTPLYKARLEALADQSRKLLAYVMEQWAPVTVKTLEQAVGIPKSSISTLMLRLQQDGLVEKVSIGSRKRLSYQVSERFFNIWYLMRSAPRSARARVGWLVEFMRLWYSKPELENLARLRLRDMRDGGRCDGNELEYSRATVRAMPYSKPERRSLDWEIFKRARKTGDFRDLYDLHGEDAAYVTSHDYLQRFEALRPALMRVALPEHEKQAWADEVLGCILLSLAEKEQWAKECEHENEAELADRRSRLVNVRKLWIKYFGLAAVEQVEKALRTGDLFRDCTDFELALTQMENCLSNSPTAMGINLGWIEEEFSPDKTLLAYKKALALAPFSSGLWGQLGEFYKGRLAQYQAAEIAYKKAIELDPADVRPWLCLGNLYQSNLNCYMEAEKTYQKAIELEPADARPWLCLGHLYQLSLDRYIEAEQAFQKAIKLDPADPLSWTALGGFYSDKLNRYIESERAFRKAIELMPDSASYWNNLAELLQNKLMRFDEAETAYRNAIELDGTDPFAYANLARLLVRLERKEEANKNYKQALLYGKDEQNLILQAHCWLGNKDYALQALDVLADEAERGDAMAFSGLKEQCYECHAIGRSAFLLELMQTSRNAGFLQPFALALAAANGNKEPLQDAPMEIRTIAEEVLADILGEQKGSKR